MFKFRLPASLNESGGCGGFELRDSCVDGRDSGKLAPLWNYATGIDDTLPYIFWTLEGPIFVVIVDTGYHPDYVAPGFAEGKNFIEPAKLLSKIGLKVDDVKTVIVTHFHQDHFTGFDFFPSAKFVIQRAEYEFWTGPLMRYEYLNRLIRPRVRAALAKMIEADRVQFVDGDVELQPGLEVLKATGHTPGSQMAAVETSAGTAVICGDAAFTYRSLREHVPTGFYQYLA